MEMELNDLKLAWNKFSSKDATEHQLAEEAIYDMLKKRTKNLIERIDRNIKIGFGVLILLTLFFMFGDFFISPLQIADEVTPAWIQIMEGIGILFILLSFVYFWLNYRSATKNYSQNNNLSQVLHSIIRILYVYRKLFYLALGILLLVVSISFVTGLYSGVALKAQETGRDILTLSGLPQMERTILLGLGILVVFISGLFFLFRWGYRKLYGNYISELKKTLQELDEVERFD
jgi:hypothetical protein